jgi:hypothetical protein
MAMRAKLESDISLLNLTFVLPLRTGLEFSSHNDFVITHSNFARIKLMTRAIQNYIRIRYRILSGYISQPFLNETI